MQQHDVHAPERAPVRDQHGCFPTFLVLGAPHSGGDTLAAWLRQLPAIYAPPNGPPFFTENYDRGPRWYQNRFWPPDGAVTVGDVITDHLVPDADHAIAAARIDGLLPEVRLIVAIRDPVDRALAHFSHLVVEGRIPTSASIEELLAGEQDPHRLVSTSRYGQLLLPYVQRFGERLELVEHDELLRRPATVTVEIAKHIGAPVTTDPRTLSPEAPTPRAVDVPEMTRQQLEPYFEDDLELLHRTTGFRFGSSSS